MDNYFRNRAGRLFLIDIIAITLTLILVPALASADGVPEARTSFSEGQFVDGRAGSDKTPDLSAVPNTKSRNEASQAIGSGFRIFDAGVRLFFDDDRDGHFYGLDVRFDADTDFFASDVYARLYLSYEGGPWEHYFTTDIFTLIGASGVDDYLVTTELFDGYPTGYYDVLIELYDSFGFFVAELGPEDTSALSVLPLEDQQKDTSFVVPVSGGVSVSSGGGGAIGLVGLLPLALIAWRRRSSA